MEIKIANLGRCYVQDDKTVEAVKDVSIQIPSNTIYGIIGKSGAGKSTLVRLISLLEKPDSGEIFYDNKRVDNLSKKDLILQHRRIGRMYEGIEYRGFEQKIVEDLAKYSGVPVWNGLTNEYHPTQMLADMLTIREHLGSLQGKKLVYFGDARYNIGNSLCIVCSKLGLHFTACSNRKYFPAQSLVDECAAWNKESGGSITLTEDIESAVKDADIIYTDVWVSMGEPDEVWAERIKDLKPYQVTSDVMKKAKPSAIFMHDLPSFHNLDTTIGKEISKKFGITEMEVTDEVFESSQSVVFDEAENRMHTIKAVIAATI